MAISIRKGALIRHGNRFYFVQEVTERHKGQQKPTIHVTLRSISDGRLIEHNLEDLADAEEVEFQQRTAQYLYRRGDVFVFMDTQSFEELEMPLAFLEGTESFLKEGQEYKLVVAEGKPIKLDLPESVVLTVAQTAAPSHAVGTAANVLKEAIMDNGLMVRVPLFIKTGDKIRVSTRTREYLGKA